MPLAPVTPDCSSRAACRYGRLPAIPAPPREPGSLPRQRFDNRRCQPAWDRSRDAHPGLSRKFDLDRRRRGTLGSIPDRGDQYRGKTMADPDLPSPAINLPGANLRGRAISVTTAPGARLAATIARFCSALQRRRRSGPVMTSNRAIALSLASVQTPSFAPVLTSPNRKPYARRPSPDGYEGTLEIFLDRQRAHVRGQSEAALRRTVIMGNQPPHRSSERPSRETRRPPAADCDYPTIHAPDRGDDKTRPNALTKAIGEILFISICHFVS